SSIQTITLRDVNKSRIKKLSKEKDRKLDSNKEVDKEEALILINNDKDKKDDQRAEISKDEIDLKSIDLFSESQNIVSDQSDDYLSKQTIILGEDSKSKTKDSENQENQKLIINNEDLYDRVEKIIRELNGKDKKDEVDQNPVISKDEDDYQQLINLSLNHIEGQGIGYNTGYTTLEALIFPKLFITDWSTYADLRVHYMNTDEYAANAGFGFRYYSSSSENVYGLNLYYDYRNSKHDFHVNQIGVGAELLKERFDLRLNLYFPLDKNEFVSREFKNFDGGFVLTTINLESALRSIYFDLGYLFEDIKNFSVYGGFSQYYLHKDRCTNGFGGRLRLELNIMKYLSLEGRASYDTLFHIRYEGKVSLRFPLGEPQINKIRKILTKKTWRNEIIPIRKTQRFEWNW
nr:hypothetical protein [Candidatus Anoxychlamydiales bacterium]